MFTRLYRAALLAAFVFPALSLHPARAEQPRAEPDEVANEQMVAAYRDGQIGRSVWVVDSRPAAKYASGHIPGAVSLPLDLLSKDPAGAAERVGAPKNAKLVFYCAGRECTLSVDSAAIFRKLGYTDAWVYRNGVPGWNQKAQPLLAEKSFIDKGNLVLIDPMPGRDTLVTGSNQTLQLSLADLKGDAGRRALGQLSRNAPLVVIERGDMKAVEEALEELRDLDFRRLAYFPLAAWPGKLASAPAAAGALAWAPQYGPHQVSPKAFEEAVAAGRYILDVRPAADFARGHFKGAVNLPVEDLEKAYTQVPRDVPVYVNCATGAKSTKANDILRRKGYEQVMYLDAEISCKLENCTIKE